MPDWITAPPLAEGDQVAIVAPGNGPGKAVFPEVYELGLERLRDEFDLQPVEYPTVEKDPDYLSAHPEERAQDIMDAFQDPDISGIIAQIGGTGDQLKILRHLDPTVLRDNPTRFYGYSDNTSLACYFWKHRLATAWLGPMVMTELGMQGSMHNYTIEYCNRAFFDENIGSINASIRFTDDDLDWGDPANLEKHREMEPSPGWDWHNRDHGPVSGRVWGGCLEVLEMNLQASQYIPEPARLDGTILALETSEEVPDHAFVERMLISMGERGLLQQFAGVMVGRAKARHRDIVVKDGDERKAYREKQQDTIRNVLQEYNPDIPAVFNIDFGHTDPIVPLPIGRKATLRPRQDGIELG